jgi:cell division protein FtsQ
VIIAGCILAATILFFQIKNVEVVGETRYTDAEIMEAGGITLGENMFLYNKFRSIDGILSGCPYLDRIVVRRRLPDTIQIQVTEAEAVCFVSHDEIVKARNQFGEIIDWPMPTTYYLMDIHRKILEEVDAETAAGYPELRGVTLQKPKVGKTAVFSDEQKGKQAFTLLNTAKNNDILKNIQWVDVGRSYALKLQYTDRFQVNFGTIDDLDRKCRFMLYVAGELSAAETGTIDVSDTTTARFIKE